MSDIVFKPFGIQKDFLKSRARIRGAFSGKRSGKTEIGSIASILMQEKKPNWVDNKIDPYLGVIIGPTIDMTKRLSWKKFMAYAKPFVKSDTVSPLFAKWHDNSEVIGISADRPERLEGLKANWIWIDEVLQCSEQLFLECRARIADSEGFIICTSSLGVQYINPKQHWAYKYFVENPDDLTEYFTWSTIDNPYFPKEEINRLKESLDARTFRAMFEIDWDTTPLHAVYPDFSDENILSFDLNPKFETIIGIDWGYAHPMAVCFLQYDRVNDIFYQFDEILKSKLTLDKLYQLIKTKIDHYNLKDIKWVADVAGNQEREQLGYSNIKHFWTNWGIRIQSSRMKVLKSIAIVRSYVKNSNDRVRYFVHPRCQGSIDGFKRYSYVVKDGIVQNENPQKVDDDMMDCIRYGIVNGSKSISGIEIS